MPIFVINLASSVDRRQRIQAQLDTLQLPFELFEAIDGYGEHHPLFGKYNDLKRKFYKRYRVSTSELGCYASHYQLWEKCVELGQPIVVMEDDVDVDEHFYNAFFQAAKMIDKYGYIRLCGLFDRPYVTVETKGDYRMVRYLHGPAGTQCYMIHTHAAKRLLEHSQEWFLPVDDFLDTFWVHHVDCFALLPYAVKAAAIPATIRRDQVIYDTPWERLRRGIHRNWGKLQRHIYNWTYAGGKTEY